MRVTVRRVAPVTPASARLPRFSSFARNLTRRNSKGVMPSDKSTLHVCHGPAGHIRSGHVSRASVTTPRRSGRTLPGSRRADGVFVKPHKATRTPCRRTATTREPGFISTGTGHTANDPPSIRPSQPGVPAEYLTDLTGRTTEAGAGRSEAGS